MSELPRVLVCSFDVVPHRTGSAWRLREALTALTAHFQVVALTLKTPELPHITNYQGARLLRVPLTGEDEDARLKTFARAVRRQLESEEYALVYFTDSLGGLVLSETSAQGAAHKIIYDAARFPSFELDRTQIGTPDPELFLHRLRRQELSCLISADAVLIGSPLTRTFLETQGVEPKVLHLLRTPARLGFVPSPLPSPSGALKLVYVGSAERWQGLEVLLEAMARVPRSVSLSLQIVGHVHAVQTPLLKAQVKRLGLDDRVHFHGPVTAEILPGLIAEADVGLLPLLPGDRHERVGAPLAKISDYLAAGRGVIAADLPASRALLDEAQAIFFRAGDSDDLARCLETLAHNPSARSLMGQHARQAAESHLGVLAFRRQLRALCLSLLGVSPTDEQGPPEAEDYTQVTEEQVETIQRAEPRGSEEYTQLQDPDAAAPPRISLVTDPAGVMPFPPRDEGQSSLTQIAVSADSPEAVGADRPNSIPNSTQDALDPWQALVLHGYCPPPTRASLHPSSPTRVIASHEPGHDKV